MAKKNSPGSGNPLVVGLKSVFGPLAEHSASLTPELAYGLPVLVTILLISVLKTTLPTNIALLLALAIVAPLVAYIVTLKSVRDEKAAAELAAKAAAKSAAPSAGQAFATIESPERGESVDRTIECSGSAKGIPPDRHLWLAVEERNFLWPKEGEVIVDEQGKWKGQIFEDGVAEEFAVSLFMADPVGDQFIRTWLETGKRSGYTELKGGIPGTTRLTRKERLRLKPRP
jgi:hypothetical protein